MVGAWGVVTMTVLPVAQALLDPGFRAGRVAIEYATEASVDAYHTRQVVCVLPWEGSMMLIERHRGFRTTPRDPWPEWHAIRDNGCGPNGFYGLWLPHPQDLWAACKLVTLATKDRYALEYPKNATRATRVPLGERVRP